MFYSYDNFSNLLYYAMIEEDNEEDKNSFESNNRSEKTVIKLRIADI